ncbi:uncharacterized protein LOC114536224 [Dendronephthya gigantea]|uniref:uncharacterized protein LOC114536224 n=1 Tax=Dendronephthya gigantea TaxID=151771 RepID=UPI00106B12A9|nr:uncharacterized protein LOC114536224 [Dendronephthya gigantea]
MFWLWHRWIVSCGISLLVVKGFFLRHPQSRKCIAAKTPTFRSDNYGSRYWIEMVTNCLSDTALFRYDDNKLLHNIETEGNVVSDYGSYNNRLFIYDGNNKAGRDWANSTKHSIKQTVGRSLFLYKERLCVQPSVKYVDVKNASCRGTDMERFTYGSVTQYGGRMKDVHCSPIQRMMIHKAHYGDFNNGGTFYVNATIDKYSSLLTSCRVKSLCGGNRSCELTIDNNLLLSQYCPDTTKELYIEYTCVDNYINRIRTASNLRLSKSANEGFLEVQNGRTWRKVNEENWDKNHQRMLCKHLGFGETGVNAVKKVEIGANEKIGTGDLVCYSNTRSSETSCCAHLVPSTTTSNMNISYVECKFCNKTALFQDQTAFPDSVFSGNGSTRYSNARFTKDGWCTQASQTKCLLIDLQREYHITQVVTMGNKDQTKWIERYTMAYSHDESYTNEIQMTGNKNGYQASRTRLDIYNVKHIKIQSTGKNDFCLRIELCGEVQSPAPVYDFQVVSTYNSAELTWKIRTEPKDSSYITHYNISIDQKHSQRISRETYGTKFTISFLQPSTTYSVQINTEDSSGQKSEKVYKNFTTKEPEPANPIASSHYTMTLHIPKPDESIKEVMIIVQNSKSGPVSSKIIKTSDLTKYRSNTQDPYITGYLKADVLPLTFVIGDGKIYGSENENYPNKPLTANSNYFVFLRFFKSQNSYYSTEWSDSISTMAKPSDENVINRRQSETSREDKFRMDLLIPLFALAFCLLVALGVIVYQRRLLQKQKKLADRDRPRSEGAGQEIELDYVDKSAKCNEFANDEGSFDDEGSYVIEEDVTVHETATEQEYTTLRDNQDLASVYQALDDPEADDGQYYTEMDNESVEYVNAVFN